MSDDTKALVAQVVRAGYPVQEDRRHYVAVINGKNVVIAKTPSDRHSLANARAELRRAGADLTPTKRTRGATPDTLAGMVLGALAAPDEDWSDFTARDFIARLDKPDGMIESSFQASVHNELNRLAERGGIIKRKVDEGRTKVRWTYPVAPILTDRERIKIEEQVRKTSPIQPERTPPPISTVAPTAPERLPRPVARRVQPAPQEPEFWKLLADGLRSIAQALEAPDNPWRKTSG